MNPNLNESFLYFKLFMSQRKSCLPGLFKILCQFAQTTTSQSKHQKKIKENESFYDYNLTNSTNSPNQVQIMKTPSTSILI